MLQAEASTEKASALDKARLVLNNMMKETEEQKDLTNANGDKFKEETMESLDVARTGKAQCETSAAKATSGLNEVML